MNKNKNVSESKRAGQAVKAKKKQCYINAMRVIWYVPEYEQADYVEGYAVIDCNFCIEHGWVEQGGVVIDPTLHDDGIVFFLACDSREGWGSPRRSTSRIRTGVRTCRSSTGSAGEASTVPSFVRQSWQRTDTPEWRTWRCGMQNGTGRGPRLSSIDRRSSESVK